MTDARIVRTRAALHGAVLELAAQKPITEISVSELAQLAGINRVTFYKHFAAPADVLSSALSRELDPALDNFIARTERHEDDPVLLFLSGVDMILDHVERRRAVYEISISSQHDGTISNLLADHFTVTLTRFLENRMKSAPPTPEIELPMAARYFAHGLCGAVRAWVTSNCESRESFLRSLLALVPDWWFPEHENRDLSTADLLDLELPLLDGPLAEIPRAGR
ncbi:TetR/AcrR family transcriptional regulator C-terminal domain-containing protein [Leucobacter sp. CSA2]|uniref:TetR/AcrR family transcriptional regulator C-terminal domain-containing protein n=1 Tax=Leucobacter edaphi TaxID=2796472 RepID=A0A934UYJ8_9MICO|nr:TetR/AcrR family transcriptional regulator [Leucobacter edaphi]MBK0422673.1 TetR/AcrR family transcriptional regulator C-terminal domain-containing protein [Leucobacter edaphi]